MSPPRCVLRGGGDLATGVAWRLTRLGCRVVVLELDDPLTVRRTVALSTAVRSSLVDIEGMTGRLATDLDTIAPILDRGEVAVVVCPDLPDEGTLPRDVVVDARLAKQAGDTTIHDAGRVIGLGPGFLAGENCHAIVETMRGHRLGRVIWSGSACSDTGSPGIIAGKGAERVLRAPSAGHVSWQVEIGDRTEAGEVIGTVHTEDCDETLVAPFAGIARGLIRPGRAVAAGLKIADIDPRLDPSMCHQISDKALAVGGGVVEAAFASRSAP